MTNITITEEEWLRELDKLTRQTNVTGLTRREIRTKLKLGDHSARNLIRNLQAEGRLEINFKYVRDITGRVQRVPIYRVITAKKGKK